MKKIRLTLMRRVKLNVPRHQQVRDDLKQKKMYYSVS